MVGTDKTTGLCAADQFAQCQPSENPSLLANRAYKYQTNPPHDFDETTHGYLNW